MANENLNQGMYQEYNLNQHFSISCRVENNKMDKLKIEILFRDV
jgi:hypothetical protein